MKRLMRRQPRLEAEEAVLTIPEAALLLRISPGTAYLAAKGGSLPVVKVGGSLRVPRAKLEELLGLAGNRGDGGKGTDHLARKETTNERHGS